MINLAGLARTEQAATYLRLIARWWWLPVFFSLFSATVTYVGTGYLIKPVYGASTTLQVSGGSPGIHTATDAQSDATLITTGPVLASAYRHLDAVGRREVSALYRTSCSADIGDVFVTCSTTGRDYRALASILNTLARTFIGFNARSQNAQYGSSLNSLNKQQKQIKAAMAKLQKRLTALQSISQPSQTEQYQITALQSQITQDQTNLSQIAVQEATTRSTLASITSAVQVVNPASPNPHALGPHPARNAALGFIIGLGMGIGLIVLLEYLDDTFRSVDEVGEVTTLPILGAVLPFDTSQGGGLVAWSRPRSALAEAYRVVRTNIQFANLDRELGALLLTSARDGEGKTTSAANLAIALALGDRRVLLIDGDLRRHGLSSLFGMRDQPGLSNALLGSPMEGVTHETEIPNLSVVPSGPLPPNPAELLGSGYMREWMDKACSNYDIAVVDTSPILSVADARILAALVDSVILIVDPTLSSRRLVLQARLALQAVGARLLGVIVNRAQFYSQDSYYKYYYYYDRYDTAAGTPNGRRAAGVETDLVRGEETRSR